MSVVLHDSMTDKCKGVLRGYLRMWVPNYSQDQSPILARSLVLAELRASVQGKEGGMEQWDEFLDEVVHAINTRVLKVHSFSPSQLCIGFNVRLHSMGESVVESMRNHQLQQNIALYTDRQCEEDVGNRCDSIGRAHYEARLAALEEMRELTREGVMRSQDERELKMVIPRYAIPSVNDLVLRRRFAVGKAWE